MSGRVAPGAVIGMLGAGQLGRMTAIAAARLGYRVHVFAPDAIDSPTQQVCWAATAAAWTDGEALDAFARSVDVVTLEWENVPVEVVERLALRVPVRPGAGALWVSQDRVTEKSFINAQGVPTAPWRAVTSADETARARDAIGPRCVVKTTRLGYDGKGQARLDGASDAAEAWRSLNTDAAIVEGFVDFVMEVSVIVARGVDGATRCYPVVENRHENGILDRTLVPARVSPEIAIEAERIAVRLATAMEIVGLLAVEMFVTPDGRVLVNETAPRPHNSGHWTLDGAETDQFEQLIRAVCGLPLGSVARLGDAEMENLLGEDEARVPDLLAESGAHLHLYGKAEWRRGRKMGHVTRVFSPTRERRQ